MKKNLKKATAVLLALLMVTTTISVLPLTVSAEEVTTDSVGVTRGTTGNCAWTLDDEGTLTIHCVWTLDDEGTFTIDGEGAMADYDDADNIAPWAGLEFSKLVIEDGVTGVGDFAFGSCQSLAEVSLPDSLKNIGFAAFENCDSLTSITIPKSVTGIEYYAFNYCDNLTSIQVAEDNPKFDSRGNCNAVIETKSNTLIFGCNGSVIPKTVTSIGQLAFKGCKTLNGIVLPEKLTSIGFAAFELCESLDNITIPNSVTSIGNKAFKDCKSLKSINIPDGIAEIGYCAFYSCGSLEKIIVPKSVTSIGDYAFYGCGSLSDVYYIGTEESKNNISIGSYNEKFTLANTHFYSIGDINMDGCLSITDCTALQRYLAKFKDLTDVQLALADTNGDGYVDIRDATHLQMYLAEFDVVLGKE